VSDVQAPPDMPAFSAGDAIARGLLALRGALGAVVGVLALGLAIAQAAVLAVAACASYAPLPSPLVGAMALALSFTARWWTAGALASIVASVTFDRAVGAADALGVALRRPRVWMPAMGALLVVVTVLALPAAVLPSQQVDGRPSSVPPVAVYALYVLLLPILGYIATRLVFVLPRMVLEGEPLGAAMRASMEMSAASLGSLMRLAGMLIFAGFLFDWTVGGIASVLFAKPFAQAFEVAERALLFAVAVAVITAAYVARRGLESVPPALEDLPYAAFDDFGGAPADVVDDADAAWATGPAVVDEMPPIPVEDQPLPAAAEPAPSTPASLQSGLVVETQPEIVVTEEIVAEEIVAEEIVAEEIVAEEIVAEEIVAEEIVAEEIVAEEIVAEEIVAEEIVAEEVVSEEIVAEESPQSEAPPLEIKPEEPPPQPIVVLPRQEVCLSNYLQPGASPLPIFPRRGPSRGRIRRRLSKRWDRLPACRPVCAASGVVVEETPVEEVVAEIADQPLAVEQVVDEASVAQPVVEESVEPAYPISSIPARDARTSRWLEDIPTTSSWRAALEAGTTWCGERGSSRADQSSRADR